jgi:DNA-binding transcriptional regulator PaaX
MKGKITYAVLERIEKATVDSTDLFVAFLKSGYGASPGKIFYEAGKLKSERIKDEEIKEAKKRFNKLIFRLKDRGLVEKRNHGRDVKFKSTKKGREKFEKMKKEKLNSLPQINYPKPKGNEIILVSFDIPEDKRKKRDWLRGALKYLGFKLVHQSVFIGKGRLSEAFLEDIEKMELLKYTEIIKVEDSGTLKNIT